MDFLRVEGVDIVGDGDGGTEGEEEEGGRRGEAVVVGRVTRTG